MRKKHRLEDYEAVTRSHSKRAGRELRRSDQRFEIRPLIRQTQSVVVDFPQKANSPSSESHISSPPIRQQREIWIARNGHSLSYAGIFLFTFLVFFRPYELFPSLSWLSKGALVVAIITLAAFVPTQLGLENRITVKPREIKLVFGLVLTGALSIPLAMDPSRAFQSFVEFLKVVVIFVVMVNVLRTDKRLRRLLMLVLLASCVLSVAALNDYRNGNLALEGRRIAGVIGGLFSNPNDLALHLVTMIPLAITMFFASRKPAQKMFYFVVSLLLMAGMVSTFSRGGFLGFLCVVAFLVWRLAQRNRAIFGAAGLVVILALVVVAPSAYRSRITTTNDDSAVARTDDLKRSIAVAARHPLFGVGMDNYIIYSNLNKATHNAYTQVAAEMGLAAFIIYLGFLLTPFRRLRKIERTVYNATRKPPEFYLAVGLQASLLAYMVVSFFASVAYLWYAYYLVAYAVTLERILAGRSETPKTTTA